MTDGKRRLLWHGTLLALLGLATGGVLQSFANPRLGLAAHTGGVMNGTILLAIGAAWAELRLRPASARAAFWALVVSGYANWFGLVLAAGFGTTLTTPLLGDGTPALPWQENLVALFLVGGAIVTLTGVVLVLLGFRRRID
jgi:hydroxylaminobenzene mutase